jgi:hypothetical protein
MGIKLKAPSTVSTTARLSRSHELSILNSYRQSGLRTASIPANIARTHPHSREKYTPGWLHWRIDCLSHRPSRGLTRVVGSILRQGSVCATSDFYMAFSGSKVDIVFPSNRACHELLSSRWLSTRNCNRWANSGHLARVIIVASQFLPCLLAGKPKSESSLPHQPGWA